MGCLKQVGPAFQGSLHFPDFVPKETGQFIKEVRGLSGPK